MLDICLWFVLFNFFFGRFIFIGFMIIGINKLSLREFWYRGWGIFFFCCRLKKVYYFGMFIVVVVFLVGKMCVDFKNIVF